MRYGLSSISKWIIAITAILTLAMGISGVASANRASAMEVDQAIFANTLLLHDNANVISLLEATVTESKQTLAAPQTNWIVSSQSFQSDNDTGVDPAQTRGESWQCLHDPAQGKTSSHALLNTQ